MCSTVFVALRSCGYGFRYFFGHDKDSVHVSNLFKGNTESVTNQKSTQGKKDEFVLEKFTSLEEFFLICFLLPFSKLLDCGKINKELEPHCKHNCDFNFTTGITQHFTTTTYNKDPSTALSVAVQESLFAIGNPWKHWLACTCEWQRGFNFCLKEEWFFDKNSSNIFIFCWPRSRVFMDYHQAFHFAIEHLYIDCFFRFLKGRHFFRQPARGYTPFLVVDSCSNQHHRNGCHRKWSPEASLCWNLLYHWPTMSKMVCMAPYQKAKEILRPQPIDVTFCDTQMFFNLAGQLGIFHKAEVHIGMNYYQKKFWKKIRLSVRQMSDVQNSWMCVRCS